MPAAAAARGAASSSAGPPLARNWIRAWRKPTSHAASAVGLRLGRSVGLRLGEADGLALGATELHVPRSAASGDPAGAGPGGAPATAAVQLPAPFAPLHTLPTSASQSASTQQPTPGAQRFTHNPPPQSGPVSVRSRSPFAQ